MEAIIRNVKDIDPNERHYLETALGKQLKTNQQVIIHVINVGVEPEQEVRQEALSKAADIARQGRANASVQGVSEEEVDAVIDEAIAHVRQHSA